MSRSATFALKWFFFVAIIATCFSILIQQQYLRNFIRLQSVDLHEIFSGLKESLQPLRTKIASPVTGYEHEEDPEKYVYGGYHPVNIGDSFKNNKYVVRRKLGFGEYSTVWLAEDMEQGQYVALKILTANSTVGETELDETNLLLHASSANRTHPGYSHVVTLLDHFKHEGVHGVHICLVFEVLGGDLNSLLDLHIGSIPIDVIKPIARQVLLGLDYLHTSCGIIHTDIKPSNILLGIEDAYTTLRKDLQEHPPVPSSVQRASLPPRRDFTIWVSQPLPTVLNIGEHVNVKVADLGVGNWVDNHFVQLIQSPPYRSPEVVLRATWDTSADIWSTACLIYYLLTSEPLFRPQSRSDAQWTTEEELLAQMIELLGPIPMGLIERGKHSGKYLTREGSLTRIDGIYPRPLLLRLTALGWSTVFAEEFAAFLLPMLRYEPERRASAFQALQHPWLQ